MHVNMVIISISLIIEEVITAFLQNNIDPYAHFRFY